MFSERFFSKHDFQQMIVKGKHDYHELQGIHDGKLGRDYHNWFESSGVCALCLENQVLTHMGLLTERNSNNYQLNILVGQEQRFSDLTTWLITAHNTDNYIYTTALGQSGDKNRTWWRQNEFQMAQLQTFSGGQPLDH